MNIGELVSLKTVENKDDLLGQKEKHTPYHIELKMYSCVQQGDVDKLLDELKNIDSLIVMGKMSNDDLMQYKYMAVSTITLATRYAIQGGLNEKIAYDFSDNVIMLVDSLTTKEEILSATANEIIKLTNMVAKNKVQPTYSPYVRKTITYINENITKKITVAELSEHCGISSDYLSQVFKKEIGENLSSYVTRKKLEAAKTMLMNKQSNAEICRALGFSSQSHFITAFKKYYHMTPTEYIKLTR